MAIELTVLDVIFSAGVSLALLSVIIYGKGLRDLRRRVRALEEAEDDS